MAVALSVSGVRGTYVSPICMITNAIPNAMTAVFRIAGMTFRAM